MTTSPKTIIFDYGKVLLEWDPRRIFQSFFPGGPQAVDAFLNEISFMEWHGEQDQGRTFAEAIAERSAKFPQYAHVLAVYDTAWENSVVGSIDGTVDILRRLKQAGYPLYGLSNYPAEKFRLDRQRFAFFDWFDDMVISSEIRLTKPDPAIFRFLLAKIGRTAQECIFIDDASANVAAARELGFTAIQFHDPQQLEQELQKLGIL